MGPLFVPAVASSYCPRTRISWTRDKCGPEEPTLQQALPAGAGTCPRQPPSPPYSMRPHPIRPVAPRECSSGGPGRNSEGSSAETVRPIASPCTQDNDRTTATGQGRVFRDGRCCAGSSPRRRAAKSAARWWARRPAPSQPSLATSQASFISIVGPLKTSFDTRCPQSAAGS